MASPRMLAPFAELIAALGQAREAHLADDRVGLAAAMTGLEAALDGATGLRAGVGIAAERLEAITESHRSAILYLDEIVAGIEDTDLAAVLTRIASDQTSARGRLRRHRQARLALAGGLPALTRCAVSRSLTIVGLRSSRWSMERRSGERSWTGDRAWELTLPTQEWE